MRLSAKEPITAKPSARQALTATSVSNTCLRTRSNSEMSISARMRPTEKPSSRRERVSHARPDAVSMMSSSWAREALLNVRGNGALHREFQRVRRRKHLPVGERNDCEANLEPSVTVARAIERVESFPDVGMNGRSKHRGRQSIEIGARQKTQVIFLIRLQSIQHDLRNDEGDANQETGREQRNLPGKRPIGDVSAHAHYACAFTSSHFSSVPR